MRWSCAKIHIVRENGFIPIVLMRRICLKGGIVWIARNRKIRLKILILEASLLTEIMMLSDQEE